METQAQYQVQTQPQTQASALDQVIAKLESEIQQELQKIGPEQRKVVEVAGLQAMHDRIAQRVKCLTTGQDCEKIAGIDIGWF